MITYVVTGGAGFIGSHLCDRLLAEGKRVVAVDDLSTGRIANLSESRTYGQQFTFHNIDIRLDELGTIFQRARPEVVFHLAAQSSAEASAADPILDASVNVMGLLNVLEAAAMAGARKVVFAASGATLYGEPKEVPTRESALRGARHSSPFAVAKAIALDYLRFYRRARGLDSTALALASVYGPRQDPNGAGGVVALFASRMVAGEPPIVFGDGEQTRDYVFVDDAVHAFSLAATKGAGALLNVGTGVETTVKDLVRLLGRVVGFQGEATFGSAREGEIRRSALDVSAAAKHLGWKPWTSLKEGLRATVESLQAG